MATMVERGTPKDDRQLRPMVYEPKAGELFAGRYRIQEILGRGATGAVWAALDEAVGDQVALKLLVAGPDDAAERFRREVRLARRVTHRNAARIFDLGAVDGVLYLTMEQIDGESLEDLLKRESPLSVAQAAEIGRQIALGLGAAHEVSVVHRDIKPANVLLEKTGRVVLTDFGVARAMADDAQVTNGIAMIGTPSYMAPEQVRGETVSPATDLYALGAMLYQMLTGICPFVTEDAVSTAMLRLAQDPEDPRSHVALTEEVASLVLWLLNRVPAERPSSAIQVAEILAGWTKTPTGNDSAATLFGSPSVLSTATLAPSGGLATSTMPGSSSTAGGTFISVAPADRTLAVLPFRVRGPAEHAYVAESLAEDLTDVLTTTRGLRVTASGATARYEGQSVDPREAGRELGADAIVDGTARFSPKRLQVSARLVDVATGEQLWVDRFDWSIDDALELHDVLAQRIAESLRLQLELLSARHRVPQDAVDLLLAARQRTANSNLGDDPYGLALELLDRALEIAPDFDLGIATHADYAVRRWFLPARGGDQAITQQAHDSVARALEVAPFLPVTRLAAARLAVSDGSFGDAASQLAVAIEIAPTFAAAHDYLGMLQCEAGRADEGERHILLARQLDPSLPMRSELARHRALMRDLDGYRELLAELKATPSVSRFMIESLEMRVAGWFGDRETVRLCRPSRHIPPEHGFYRLLEAQRSALLGEGSVEELMTSLDEVLKTIAGPRFDAFLHQMAIESLVPLGDLDVAFEELRVAVGMPAFVDTVWMEHCPVLDDLRSRPGFAALAAQVNRRADAIWRMRTT